MEVARPLSAYSLSWATAIIGPSILLVSVIILSCFHKNPELVARNRQICHQSFSRFFLALHFIVTASFVIDCITVVIGIVIDQWVISFSLVCYNSLCYIAWSINLTLLMNESKRYPRWHWIQYMFWFITLVIDTVVGWSLVIEFFKYDLGKKVLEYLKKSRRLSIYAICVVWEYKNIYIRAYWRSHVDKIRFMFIYLLNDRNHAQFL